MRDVLPELLGDASGRAELDAARAHVAECESCREELAFLRDAQRAMRAPRVDVSRIAAAIPPYRPVPAWGRVARSGAVQIAAGLVIVVGLAAMIVRREEPAAGDTTAIVATATGSSELMVGTLSDLSESDLQDLLQDLGDLEAVTSTEEDVVVLPALDRNGV